MKHIATTIVLSSMMFAGTAKANGLPCTKLQLWVTSLPTVPAGAEMHRDDQQVNIAAITLKPRAKTRIAQGRDITIANRL